MLTKRERNKIYENIVRHDLDPAEFKLEDTGETVSVTHNSGSQFEIIRQEIGAIAMFNEYRIGMGDKYRYETKFSVADGVNQSSSAPSIDFAVTASVSGWLREIKATVGVPDYWQEMQDSQGSIAVIQRGDFPNTPFSPAEQEQIAAQLQEVKKQVKELYGLSNSQMTQVNEKLDSVIEDASRLGRKDWVVIFIGTILPLVLSDVLTWGAAHHILALTLHGLVHLFTNGIELPQIPSRQI